MPIYVYQTCSEAHCQDCESGFEILQKLDEPRLSACPECGAPVTRVVTAANIASSGPSLSEENIGKKGFTQYRKLEKGVYEKTVGDGPDMIKDKQ